MRFQIKYFQIINYWMKENSHKCNIVNILGWTLSKIVLLETVNLFSKKEKKNLHKESFLYYTVNNSCMQITGITISSYAFWNGLKFCLLLFSTFQLHSSCIFCSVSWSLLGLTRKSKDGACTISILRRILLYLWPN